jgi:hypothetical protein
MNTLTVYRNGGEDQYVSKEDHDRAIGDYDQLVLVHEALQVTADAARKNYLHHVADLELARARACDRSDEVHLKTWILSLQQQLAESENRHRVPPGYISVPCDCNGKHSYHVMHADVTCLRHHDD